MKWSQPLSIDVIYYNYDFFVIKENLLIYYA